MSSIRKKDDPLNEVAELLRRTEFSKVRKTALEEVRLCVNSSKELERLGGILDNCLDDPEKRIDALMTIAAGHLHGMDISPVLGTLERASEDKVQLIRTFASGLLVKHYLATGSEDKACVVFDRSRVDAKMEIVAETGSHVLLNGYRPAIDALIIKILTDRDAALGATLREALEMGAETDPRLSVLLIGIRTGETQDIN